MITDFLLEHRWFMPAVLAILVALGPPAGVWLAARPRLAWTLTALALVPVAVFTLLPTGNDVVVRCEVQWTLPTVGRVEIFANLVLFVPLTSLAGVASRRPLLTFFAASALSAGIEALQSSVDAIGRSCDTTDWLANTLGAAVGLVLALIALRLARGRQDPR